MFDAYSKGTPSSLGQGSTSGASSDSSKIITKAKNFESVVKTILPNTVCNPDLEALKTISFLYTADGYCLDLEKEEKPRKTNKLAVQCANGTDVLLNSFYAAYVHVYYHYEAKYGSIYYIIIIIDNNLYLITSYYRGHIKSNYRTMKYMEDKNVLPPELLGRLKKLNMFSKKINKDASYHRKTLLTVLKPHSTQFGFAPWLTDSMIQVLFVRISSISTSSTILTNSVFILNIIGRNG